VRGRKREKPLTKKRPLDVKILLARTLSHIFFFFLFFFFTQIFPAFSMEYQANTQSAIGNLGEPERSKVDL